MDERCDFCGDKAIADGKTRFGPWAYMCLRHLSKYGYPNSGLVTYLDKEETKEEE